MKSNHMSWLGRDEGVTMATFGEARLVKKLLAELFMLRQAGDRFQLSAFSISDFAL